MTDGSRDTERSPGPVPQGAPRSAVPPQAGPTADGPPLTGHPATSGADDDAVNEPDEAQADAPLAGLEEAVASDIDALSRERDEYLDSLRRLQADFENYRKRVIKQQTEQLERAAESLVVKLVDVFDTVLLAQAHGGGEAVEQISGKLFDILGKEGLEVIDATGSPFDPVFHEAVAHEEGEGAAVVSEVLRTGYVWRGRVLRPAMVKVKGS